MQEGKEGSWTAQLRLKPPFLEVFDERKNLVAHFDAALVRARELLGEPA
jgi:hypothetical protein